MVFISIMLGWCVLENRVGGRARSRLCNGPLPANKCIIRTEIQPPKDQRPKTKNQKSKIKDVLTCSWSIQLDNLALVFPPDCFISKPIRFDSAPSWNSYMCEPLVESSRDCSWW